MRIDLFPCLPDDTRLWVVPLDPAEPSVDPKLEAGLAEVLGHWRHKGQAYQAAWEVLEGRLILVAEPHMARDPSGCAIDGMLRKIRRIAAEAGREVLGEEVVLARLDGQIRALPKAELGALIANGTLGPDTPILDPALHHLGQLREGRLERPLAATWIGRKYRIGPAAMVP